MAAHYYCSFLYFHHCPVDGALSPGTKFLGLFFSFVLESFAYLNSVNKCQ